MDRDSRNPAPRRLVRIAAAGLLAMLALSACGPDLGAPQADARAATQVALGDRLLSLPAPAGLSPLASVRGSEARRFENLVRAHAGATNRVLGAWVPAQDLDAQALPILCVATVARDYESLDVSRAQFARIKRSLVAELDAPSAAERLGFDTAIADVHDPEAVHVIAHEDLTRPEAVAAAISIVLLERRVVRLFTFTPATGRDDVEAMQRAHARWVQSVRAASSARPGTFDGRDSVTAAGSAQAG